ncbi:hypothetical protein GCM10008959_32280 [Deinococcus seoulensis]|uniref:Uncharacterized protein n=1 Tax=Deinococcus seoulensis TaxID=1837379 RepID=A0ABQ2RUW1_9DEIO|nr:hypothetical protein GCM10008959_32280 [Deinococcus seoulensis]
MFRILPREEYVYCVHLWEHLHSPIDRPCRALPWAAAQGVQSACQMARVRAETGAGRKGPPGVVTGGLTGLCEGVGLAAQGPWT